MTDENIVSPEPTPPSPQDNNSPPESIQPLPDEALGPPEPTQLEPLGSTVPANQERLKKAKQQIRVAWILGIVSTAITLLATLVATLSPAVSRELGFNAWNWLDVILLAGLTFGIYQKNRICAGAMFVYFLISKVIQFSVGVPNVFGIILAVLFAYGYFEGIRGTLTYHNIMKAHTAE